MKKLSIAVLTITCLVLVAGTALAAREVIVTPVNGDVTQYTGLGLGCGEVLVPLLCRSGRLHRLLRRIHSGSGHPLSPVRSRGRADDL